MSSAVILYGPPAVGKDTITRALTTLDNRYAHFRRLKCGPGRIEGYRMITFDQLRALADQDVIWFDNRYGATYVVDRPHLLDLVHEGRIPVLHLGNPNAVNAIAQTPGIRWFTIELQCPRDIAQRRMYDRATGDEQLRLASYDTTLPLAAADTVIDTALHSPHEAATLIDHQIHVR